MGKLILDTDPENVVYPIVMFGMATTTNCTPTLEVPSLGLIGQIEFVTDGVSIFIFGGRRVSTDSKSDSYRYDMSMGSWAQITSMGQKRSAQSVVKISDEEFLISGNTTTINSS